MANQQTDDRRESRRQDRAQARGEGADQAKTLSLQFDQALGAIQSDAFWANILATIPRQLDHEWFRNVATSALLADPKLLTADRRSLSIALMEAAKKGLMPGNFGEIALFVDGKNQVQYRIMYGGMLKLVRNSQDVADIDAQAIYRGDRAKLLVGKMPEHEVFIDRERGELIGAYAYARLHGSEHVMIEVASWDKIWRHAQRYSDALRQGRATPWKDEEAQPEMACKTVLHRLMKMLPKSPVVASAMAHEEDLDRADYAKDVTPQTANAPAITSRPAGWGRQFTGNGAGGEEPPTDPDPDSGARAGPPAPRQEPAKAQGGKAQQAKRAEPAPSGASDAEICRGILAEIEATDPDAVVALMDDNERAERIANLPQDMQEEIGRAAFARASYTGETDGGGDDDESPPPATADATDAEITAATSYLSGDTGAVYTLLGTTGRAGQTDLVASQFLDALRERIEAAGSEDKKRLRIHNRAAVQELIQTENDVLGKEARELAGL